MMKAKIYCLVTPYMTLLLFLLEHAAHKPNSGSSHNVFAFAIHFQLQFPIPCKSTQLS